MKDLLINSDLVFKLLAVHFLIDFCFQPESWIKDRDDKKWKSIKLYIHGFLHSILSYFILGNLFIGFAVIIGLVHVIIDPIKLKNKLPDCYRLIIDQFIHISIIFLVGLFVLKLNFNVLNDLRINWKLIVIYIFISYPTSIFISKFTEHWRRIIKTESKNEKLLINAGKWIGILERMITVTLIINGQWEGVGFLIAAKSVLRFGELKIANERNLTEYVLIGTLLSFGIAIFCGIFLIKYS